RPNQKHISRLQLKLFSLHLKAETPGSNEKQLHLRMPVIIKGHLYPLFQTGLIDIYRKQKIPVLPSFPQGYRLSRYLSSSTSSSPFLQSYCRSSSVMLRITRQGFPAAITLSGISFVTTLPEPITTLFPMVTPGLITLLPPIQTLSPMVMSIPYS